MSLSSQNVLILKIKLNLLKSAHDIYPAVIPSFIPSLAEYVNFSEGKFHNSVSWLALEKCVLHDKHDATHDLDHHTIVL